jgi:eukaryotic-like serine/threonine-protein kinase
MATDRQTSFLDRLRESQLLEPAQLDELAASPEAREAEPSALARIVLRRAWLSKYQLNQVAMGKAKDLRVGPYVLLDRLGEGGMGQVFKAHHQHMERVVALKVIRKEKLGSADAVKRFYQEIKAAAQLTHPNIVVAYDAGPAGNTHYFAMEYVEGVDLSQLVKESGPLPVALACEYIRQAAVGLQHAFEKGLVHRDIKPANLLLSGARVKGAKGAVKILDMGLARFNGGEREKGLTQTGQVIGTPDYLAPEQAMNSRAADVRADIYSLGCSLYFLLAGKAPFQGETLTQVLLQHQMEAAPPITSRTDVPTRLNELLARMMAKAPDDRYQTPAEVAEALAPFCGESEGAAGEESVFAAIADANNRKNRHENTIGGDGAAARPGRKNAMSATAAPRIKNTKDSKRTQLLMAVGGGGVVLVLLIGLLVWLLTRPGAQTAPPGPDPKTSVADNKDKEGKPKDVGAVNPKDAGQNPVKPPDQVVQPPPPGIKGGEIRLFEENEPRQRKPLHSVAFSGDGRLGVMTAHAQAVVWNLSTGQQVQRIVGQQDEPFINGVLSRDGRLLLLSGKLAVQLYETETGREVKRFECQSPVKGVALSPNGRYAATTCDGQPPKPGMGKFTGCVAQLWDVDSGKELFRSSELKFPVSQVRFSADGGRLFYASMIDYGILEIESKRETIGKWQLPSSVSALDFVPDGRFAVTACADRNIYRCDLQTGKSNRRLVEKTTEVKAVAVSGDGKRFVAAGGELLMNGKEIVRKDNKAVYVGCKVCLWDLGSGREEACFQGHASLVTCVAISADGSRALSGSMDKTMRLLDLTRNGDSGAGLPEATGASPLDKLDPTRIPAQQRPPGFNELVAVLKDNTSEVFGVAFSGNGKRLISGANDRVARVWDLTGTEPRQVAVLQGHNGYIAEVALTPDGQTAATGSNDGTVRVWDLSGAEPRVRDVIANHEGGYSSVAVSPDGKTLALSGQRGEIRLFDLGADKPKELEQLTGHKFRPASLSFSGDGRTLASVSNDRTARLWDMTRTPPVEKKVINNFVGNPMGVSLSPSGNKLTVSCMDGAVHLWDLSGAEPKEVASQKGHGEWANSCVFSPDGKSYFSTSGGATTRPPLVAVWWNSTDGSKRKEWNLPERSSSGTLSPDGRYLALSCHDRNIYILRLPSEAPGPTPNP